MKELLALFVVGTLGLAVGGGRGNGTVGTEAVINPYQVNGVGDVRLYADSDFQIRSQTADSIMHLLVTTGDRALGVAGDASGNLYFSTLDAKVWKRGADGVVAQLEPGAVLAPIGLAVVGNFLYVADKRSAGSEGRLWRYALPPVGAPELVVDNGTIRNPQLLATGPNGSVYIADTTGQRVWRRAADGTMTVIAGQGPGTSGFSGDGGPATAAQLNFPQGVAVAPDGTVFIMDTSNKRVRKVTPSGVISTVMGTGANSTGKPPAPGANPLTFPVVPLGGWYDPATETLYVGDANARLVLSLTTTANPTPVAPTSTATVSPSPRPTCDPECA